MATDPFAPPGGGNFDVRALKGSLVLITPLSHEQGVKTIHGEKDAIKANVAVLDGDLSGDDISDALIFQGRLIGQLKGRVGKGMVLGRIGQGVAEKGKNPPWLLEDPTEADKALARAYVAKNPFEQPAPVVNEQPPANPVRSSYSSDDTPPF